MENKKNELALYMVVVVLAAIAIAEAVHAAYPSQYALQVSMSTSPVSNLYPYNTTFFNITLKNEGSSISNLVFGLYVNGTSIKEYKISIPHGESTSILANYTYADNGTYVFSAIADPAHLLNIADRKAASASITVHVNQSSSPNIYTSMPNSAIENTTSFTFSGQGMHGISVLAYIYNVSEFSNSFGPTSAVLPQVFENLYPYVAYANGALATYSNGTSAYTLWLKGTISPAALNSMLMTFNLTHSYANVNGTGANIWRIGNSTSVCVFYQQGWTKLVAFDNISTTSETCTSLIAHKYEPSESNVLVGVLATNKNLSAYQSKLIYSNSTNMGSLLSYSSVKTSAMNLFQNNYGVFAGIISRETPTIKNTCYGILYNQSNTSVCSVYVMPRSGKALQQYGMVNSTIITKNYTATLYSLTNESLLLAAHASAVSLMGSLGLGSSLKWVSIFKNDCAFSNSSIGCSVKSYNYSSSTASISITNKLNSPVRINSLSCFMLSAMRFNETVNETIAPGNSITASASCESIALPVVSTGYSYNMSMNYTYMNVTRELAGTLNITSYGLG